MTHLRFDMIAAYCAGVEGHPQKVMRELGITYTHATPQSLGDQWWFWDCTFEEGAQLPKYLSILDLKPEDCVGFGLSSEGAEKITGKPFIKEVVVVDKREPLNTQFKGYSKDDVIVYWGGIKLVGADGIVIEAGGNNGNQHKRTHRLSHGKQAIYR